MNHAGDLAVKLTNTSKISKFLEEANTDKKVKDYKKEIGKAKSEFGRLGFQSKLRLELKQIQMDPRVKEIIAQCKAKLE